MPAVSKTAFGIPAPTCTFVSSGLVDCSTLLRVTPENAPILLCGRGLRLFNTAVSGEPFACCRSKESVVPPQGCDSMYLNIFIDCLEIFLAE